MNKLEMEYFLIDYLLKERDEYFDFKRDEIDMFKLFRALVNIRDCITPSNEFLDVQAKYLNLLLEQRGIVDYKKYIPIKDNIYLIQTDITLLNVDCIVNAANERLLGCYIPNHGCIDNAIHTYSGVELRLVCNEMMNSSLEETGLARITDSFNLPCKKVIHTVGPIVQNKVTSKNKTDLRNCYKNCIDLALENKMNSIAICCISTGEFHYPNEEAAIIAVNEISKYKTIDIIINVFKDEDYIIYDRLLKN